MLCRPCGSGRRERKNHHLPNWVWAVLRWWGMARVVAWFVVLEKAPLVEWLFAWSVVQEKAQPGELSGCSAAALGWFAQWGVHAGLLPSYGW